MPRVRTSRGVKTIKRTSKKVSTNTAIKKKVATLAREVKAAQAPYVLHIDQQVNLNIFTTPAVLALSVAASLPSTATGTKTLLKNIGFKGTLKLTSASSDTEIARIVVVQDVRKFDNDTAPTWLDVFNSNNVYALRCDTLGGEKMKSFKVLFDRTYTLNNGTGTLNNLKILKFSKTFKQPLHQFDYTSYSKNLIYIMYMATSATNEMDFSYENSVLMSRED